MKPRHKLAIVAGILFAVSFLLPSFGELSGIACLGFCWNVLTNYGREHEPALGGWMYYSGFVLANALFVALLAAGLCCAARSRLRRWLSVLAALQVVSWFFVNLFAKGKGDHFNIEVGYYLWLVSFVLLCAAQPAGPTGPEAGETQPLPAPGR